MGWIHTPALTTTTTTMVSLSLSSAPVLNGAHNCGSSQIQELLVTMGDGRSTCTRLTHGLRVWVGAGTGTGTLKSTRGLPVPLPRYPASRVFLHFDCEHSLGSCGVEFSSTSAILSLLAYVAVSFLCLQFFDIHVITRAFSDMILVVETDYSC